jgi:hypothetical protein
MFKEVKENKCLISVNALRHLSGFLFLFFFLSTVTAPENSISPNDTLAIIGDKIISVSDYIRSYKEKLLRLGLTDNGDTRIKYLTNLVDDELLISKAKKTGSDKTKAAQTEYKRIRMQELLNAFSSKYIEPGITITENERKTTSDDDELFKDLSKIEFIQIICTKPGTGFEIESVYLKK